MNAIRAAITVFLCVVLGTVALGWRWSATLPEDRLFGARLALSIAALFSVVGLALVWSVKPRQAA